MDEEQQAASGVTGGDAAQVGQGDQVTEEDLAKGSGANAGGDPSKSPEAGQGSDGGESKQKEPEAKPEQSRAENAKYAEMRRRQKEKEKREQELKEAEDKGRKKAEFEFRRKAIASDDLRELGLEKAESEEDVFLAERYAKAKAEGDENPKAAAYKALADRYASERKAEQEKKQTAARESAEAKRLFGKTAKEILDSDPDFAAFFTKFGSVGRFSDCYKEYLALTGRGSSASATKQSGSAPVGSSSKPLPREETDEEFRARTRKQYGNSFS